MNLLIPLTQTIDDGFTLTATIAGVGPWPPLTVTYRPALAEKVYEWQMSPKTTGKQRLTANLKLLEGQLISWDIGKDRSDGGDPCTPDNWRRLAMPILDKLMDLVTGYASPDEYTEKN